ncbi:MAG: hypothetical protein EOP84_03885 [Verrucomicrobiaceae bacterium]|nr:MAG: hypothetical protein EOP84_03885 [Verrucomicrobiaceae bacterium]
MDAKIKAVTLNATQMDATQMSMLLDGIEVAKAKRQPAWVPPERAALQRPSAGTTRQGKAFHQVPRELPQNNFCP